MRTSANPIGHSVHSFELYPTTPISRSKFNRSHKLITTLNSGYLVPIWHDLAYPGDTLICNTSVFARLATQIVPFMDNVFMDVHFWCVPIRLIWNNWTKMNGEQDNPGDSTDYLTPQLITDDTTSEATPQSIFDYFGIPLGAKSLSFNAFNFRAYNLVYNEWYRDENLQNSVDVEKGDTTSGEIANYTLLKRGKRKDYFTSCLPTPQKGPAVDLPIGLTAPVIGNGLSIGLEAGSDNLGLTNYTYGVIAKAGAYGLDNGTATTGMGAYNTDKTLGLTSDPDKSGMIVDLSNATASTINSLRQAFALQRMYETDSRGGTRYIEQILAHFGVKSPDARLQRPEFLGGGTFNLNLNIVPQTSSTDAVTPQGNLSSYGVINGTTRNIVHSFTEHCVVFAVASVRAEMTYQQGLQRDYSYRSRTDYYLPTLANLGEQAVLNKEIYAQGEDVVDSDGNIIDDLVFGYQERWAEMRYKPSRITGYTRSTAPTSLDVWHLAQYFTTLPTLSSTFIEENPPISRVIQTTGENAPEFVANFFFDEKWIRPLPVYSIPSMSSHF